VNPIDDPRRQAFLSSLPALARGAVTRAFLEEIIPGITEPEHVCAAVRAKAMCSGYRDDRPYLSRWLVLQVDAGTRALEFAAWCIDWEALPREEKVLHLADIAETRGALA
jgi:hypothetical protein